MLDNQSAIWTAQNKGLAAPFIIYRDEKPVVFYIWAPFDGDYSYLICRTRKGDFPSPKILIQALDATETL